MPDSTCAVDGCEAVHYSRGMCKPHYRKDYYLRNKARENASNKAYREARPEYWKSRWADYSERRWGAEREARRQALQERLDASHKTCTKCHEYKPKTDFHRTDKHRDGRYSWCKPCFHAVVAANVTPESRRRVRERIKADPARLAKVQENSRRSHHRNYPIDANRRAAAVARAKAWAEANPERATLARRKAANARRARMQSQAVGTIDYAAILEREGMFCHLCKTEIPSMNDMHFDHVIPLSKGGPHSEDNILPSHATCNLRKGAKLAA